MLTCKKYAYNKIANKRRDIMPKFDIQFKETVISKVTIEADTLEEAKRLFEEEEYTDRQVRKIESYDQEYVDAYEAEDF
jgi:nicotinamide mononucleotide adenylyltransferase